MERIKSSSCSIFHTNFWILEQWKWGKIMRKGKNMNKKKHG
jgi:hypothetical protein